MERYFKHVSDGETYAVVKITDKGSYRASSYTITVSLHDHLESYENDDYYKEATKEEFDKWVKKTVKKINDVLNS